MKWLVVAGIVVFVIFKLRRALVRHPVFGTAFRILLGPDTKPITIHEWFKGAALLSVFAAVGVICHFGVARASQSTSSAFLNSPYIESFGATTLWVGGLAGIGAVFSLLAGLVLSIRAKRVKAKQNKGKNADAQRRRDLT